MDSPRPTRRQADLADILELVLDKGIVINADIAITVNQTELLGIELRAAIASFETAAEYGLAFPSGTDMRRVEQASGREPLEGDESIDLGIEASSGGASQEESSGDRHRKRPAPRPPIGGDVTSEGDEGGDGDVENGTEDDHAGEETRAAPDDDNGDEGAGDGSGDETEPEDE